MTTHFRSFLWLRSSFNSPIKTSVDNVRSWASSNTITDMRSRNGSDMASRSSMPSVMNFSNVFGPVVSSNRIEYPTSSPSATSISSATRCAMLMAATRLGCVHATHFEPRLA